MTTIHLTPTEIRDRVQAQHEEIREMMQAVEAMARALPERQELTSRVPRAVMVLTDIIELHMLFEERYLFPALEAAPGFGVRGVRRLEREHARQREELTQLSGLFVDVDVAIEGEARSLQWKVRMLSRWLLDDMAEEEREALRPGVLTAAPFSLAARA